jgi:ABC-2 type transport system ATP-binding protein
MTTPQNIVEARDIRIEFRLSQYKTSTLKEYIIGKLSGKLTARQFVAVDNVSFDMPRGQCMALIGHNGSGKSTLLRAIAGIVPISGSGSVKVHGRIAPMIELGAGFDGELSGRENIFLTCLLMGLSLREIHERIEGIIDFSELREFIHSPVKNYSSGMYARLGFACATAVDPDLLIVDEVLAVGDSNFATKCLQKIEQLRKQGTSVLLVSHDESTVRRFCDRAIVLSQGHVMHDGDLDTAYQVQTRIMLERADMFLSPEERERSRKRLELIARERSTETDSSLKPTIKVTSKAIQETTTRSCINVMKSFQIQFDCQFKQPEFFSGNVFFGFELKNKHGHRIGGLGSEPDILLPEEVIQKTNSFSISFEFPEGLSILCGNAYVLYFAINDQDMRRNLFYQAVLEFELTNPSLGVNEHADVISFGMFKPKMSWSTQST